MSCYLHGHAGCIDDRCFLEDDDMDRAEMVFESRSDNALEWQFKGRIVMTTLFYLRGEYFVSGVYEGCLYLMDTETAEDVEDAVGYEYCEVFR